MVWGPASAPTPVRAAEEIAANTSKAAQEMLMRATCVSWNRRKRFLDKSLQHRRD